MPRLSRLVVCLLAAVLPLSAEAQEAAGNGGPAGASPSPLEPIDPVELEAFVDGFMTAYLEESGAAGGVVSVVQGGEPILAKGYGLADVESRREVVADTTLFRVGSVSKLFVWTAVMQLVEEGKLDLGTDVNDYLGGELELPSTFDDPITLAHLMSHSAGFEDHVLGLFARDATALRPLGEILESEMPGRVRPPGEVSAYSNHGTALAAYVVERVSGVPWDDFIATRILEPLGMARTTFSQPPPGVLAEDLSKGYRLEGDELREEGFEFVPLAAAGAVSSTATDMAKFMITHLQLGRLGRERILEETTALQMQAELFRHADGVNPMAHGFIDSSRNGQRILGHGGDTLWFHTQFEFLPEHDVGLFVSMNTAGADPSRLGHAFVDRYFPEADPPPLEEPGDWTQRAGRYVGSYRSNRFSHSDLTKLAALVGRVEVRDAGDGALLLSATGETRWIEEAPLLFREENGYRRVAFRQAEDGRITHLFLGEVPVVAFERVPPRESHRLHFFLLGSSLLLMGVALVVQPVGSFLRWRFRTPLEREQRIPASARVVLWLGALVFVVFALGLVAEMSNPMEVVFGITAGLRGLLVLPLIGAVLALISLTFAVWLWREQQGRFSARVGYTAVVVAFFVLLWQLAIWRLLGGP